MVSYLPYLLVALGAFGIVNWALGARTSQDPDRAGYAAFSTLGLFLGLLIGLSESPLVAGAVTGGFTIAAALIGKLWGKASDTQPTRAVRVDWLLGLSAAAVFGILSGAALRVNGTLDMRDHSLPAELRLLGFDEQQIKVAMDRMIERIDLPSLVKSGLPPVTGLKTGEVPAVSKGIDENDCGESFDWPRYWESMDDNPPDYILDNLLSEKTRDIVPDVFRAVVTARRKEGQSDDDIVGALRQLTDDRK